MHSLTISIFGNKIFSEIINELKLFNKYNIINQNNFDSFIKNAKKDDHLVILFINETNKDDYLKLAEKKIPTTSWDFVL